jgi:N-acetylglucosamine kinase-like BadF-type ATPase
VTVTAGGGGNGYVVGVDGGNSKTEAVVATTGGKLLARVRGPGVDSPLADRESWCAGLSTLVERARADAQVSSPAASAAYFLANVDLPDEHRVARQELAATGVARVTVVHNDTLAVLRAGATRRWGVAVVAGAGINAVGVHPGGRTARFLGLGDYSGDVGGGHGLGVQALGAAVRAGDGRGPVTLLARTVPEHYRLRRADDVAIAVHAGRIRYEDLTALAPVVCAAAAAGDPVAGRIVADFGDEVAVMANALIRRLRLVGSDVEVVLGGGLLQSDRSGVARQVRAAVTAVAPAARLRVLDVPPVFGAVTEALELAGADASARDVLRAALS